MLRQIVLPATIITTLAMTFSAFAKGATAVRPSNNPATWISAPDYPAVAVRNQAEGVVDFELKVGPDGLPTDCKVTGSSDSAALDEATCALVVKRARFEPARGADGMPIEANYSNRVRWVLPQTLPPPSASNVELSFVIEKDGSVSNCVLAEANGIPADNTAGLMEPCEVRAYDPILDEKGKPARHKVTMRRSVVVEALPQAVK